MEPWHVCLPVPAQVPSVETLPAAAEVAAALVDVALVEVAALVVVAALVAEVTAPLPPQLPKAELQPVPQWSVCGLVNNEPS